MSQFRKDVFTGRWVIVAETEAVRPGDFCFKRFTRETPFCRFCETHEASTQPEIFAPQTWRLAGEWAGLEGPGRSKFSAAAKD